MFKYRVLGVVQGVGNTTVSGVRGVAGSSLVPVLISATHPPSYHRPWVPPQSSVPALELQTNVYEDYVKLYNYGKDPYYTKAFTF